MPSDVISVSRVIPAPAEQIFALVADPTKHSLIDGSGTVVSSPEPSHIMVLGEKFGMDMKMGPKYSMVNTVVELETNRRVAWQANFGEKGPAKALTGRIWRYELEPVEGGTKVTESWDVSRDGLGWALKRIGGLRKKTASNMTKTLEQIEKVLAG